MSDTIKDEPVVFAEESALTETSDSLLFAEDAATPKMQLSSTDEQDSWKIMIVDDEDGIHDVTMLSLADLTFEDKSLSFINAHTGRQAQELIALHPDTALILLDVVMETDDAGLKVVKHIRNVVANHFVRIVLRTGQPGQAPEKTVIVDYDINDYKTKTELNSQKLFTTVVTALRAYRHAITIESQRQENSELYLRLKEYSQTLAQSEEKYRTLFEDSRDAIFITTPAGETVDINQAMLQLLDYSRREMMALNAEDVYANPADRLRFRQSIEQSGSVRDFEVVLQKKDGTPLNCLLTATVRRDHDGAILAYQGIIRDITERKRKEEMERQLEAHRNSPLGRAEIEAERVLKDPRNALIALHDLVQSAAQDPESAAIIGHLPTAMERLGAGELIPLAEAYSYFLASQTAPELLPVGLRLLTGQLEAPSAQQWFGTGQAFEIYRLCQAALEVNSVAQIRQWSSQLPSQAGEMAFLSELVQALGRLDSVVEALHAFERVNTSRDKLAYLASAVERLGAAARWSRSGLGSADRPPVQAVVDRWLAIVTGTMSEIQSRARLVCKLVTRQVWQSETIPLVLTIRNEGQAAAVNLSAELVPTSAYGRLDEMIQLERLVPGEEVQVELRVQPNLAAGIDHFRARFIIHFADPQSPHQTENFADEIYLLAEAGEFQQIPNPYVVGTPLQSGSPLFFGREDVLTFIQDNLEAEHRNNLVLVGQRRMGKTSLLKQLLSRLGDAYVPVYIDAQALGLDPGMTNFFLDLTTEIVNALEDREFDIEFPDEDLFQDRPANTFEHHFLSQVRDIIGDRHLLILIDEFEELEMAVQRGNLEPSIFGFLRHIIQHTEKLSVICCGTHRLEELVTDYWNALFNLSLHRHVAYLDRSEALRLIQEPVASFGMRYDDLALDKMWRVTAGHPYFLQLLCHSLVNRHNSAQRSYVTIADVNDALYDILAAGEAHFIYLWAESSPEERLTLAALSRMIPLTGRATPLQVVDFLAGRGVNIERDAVGQAMHHLTLRDILQSGTDTGHASDDSYRWQLGLLGLWTEEYKSLSRVVDEIAKL